MGWQERVPNPFPGTAWAEQAYQHAAYMTITTGLEFDYETGTIKTGLRFTDQVLEGSPAEILTHRGFQDGVGGIETEDARLNMSFMLGYNLAQLAVNRAAKVVDTKSGVGEG